MSIVGSPATTRRSASQPGPEAALEVTDAAGLRGQAGRRPQCLKVGEAEPGEQDQPVRENVVRLAGSHTGVGAAQHPNARAVHPAEVAPALLEPSRGNRRHRRPVRQPRLGGTGHDAGRRHAVHDGPVQGHTVGGDERAVVGRATHRPQCRDQTRKPGPYRTAVRTSPVTVSLGIGLIGSSCRLFPRLVAGRCVANGVSQDRC
jgi:hypothetical protein